MTIKINNTTYYYILLEKYENTKIFESKFNIKNIKELQIYSFIELCDYIIETDIITISVYKVKILQDSFVKINSNKIKLIDKFEIIEKIHIPTNYNFTKAILHYINNLKYINNKILLNQYTHIPYQIDPSIITEKLANLMTIISPGIIHKYKNNNFFWSNTNLFYALKTSALLKTYEFFKTIPDNYKTEEFSFNICKIYPKYLEYLPINLFNNYFYNKVIYTFIKDNLIYKDSHYKLNIFNMPSNILFYNLYWKNYYEVKNNYPDFSTYILVSNENVNNNIDCLIWLIKKCPQIYNNFYPNLKLNPLLKDLYEKKDKQIIEIKKQKLRCCIIC